MFEIFEWTERYEVSIKGREPKEGEELRASPLLFVRLKVCGHTQSTGYRRLKSVAGERTMEVFGIFCKFLEIAGNQKREHRGKLLNEKNQPATIEDLAFILDVPVEQIENAVRVLDDKKVGWIVCNKHNITKHNRTLPKIPGKSGNSRKPKVSCVQFPKKSIEYHLSSLLLTLIQQRKPDFKEALPANKHQTLQRWAKTVDLMIRLDNRTPERIEAVIRWCQQDTGDGSRWKGWQNNILSTEKLRKQFDKLEIKMREQAGGITFAPLQRGSDGKTPREVILARIESEGG